MDVALYRASEAVGGRVERVIGVDPIDGLKRVEILLDRPVSVILKVEVNRRASPEIVQYGAKRVTVAVPSEISGLALHLLVFVVFAEISFDQINQTPVPTSIGIGLRPATIDKESQALQTAVRTLLMRPGTDIWSPERGGNLRALRSQLVSGDDTTRLTRIVQVALDRYNSSAARLSSPGRTRTSAPRKMATHRVSRITLQFVHLLTRERAERVLGLLTTASTSTSVLRDNLDASDKVIAVSMLMTLQGPRGASASASTAISI